MMNKLPQSVKLARFNSKKRRGDLKKLFQNLDGKYSYSYIRGVMSGYRNNEGILSKGYRLTYRRLSNCNLLA